MTLLWLPSHENSRGAWKLGCAFLPLLPPDVLLPLEISLTSSRDRYPCHFITAPQTSGCISLAIRGSPYLLDFKLASLPLRARWGGYCEKTTCRRKFASCGSIPQSWGPRPGTPRNDGLNPTSRFVATVVPGPECGQCGLRSTQAVWNSLYVLMAACFVHPGQKEQSELMELVELLTALLCSFLFGLLIEWVLLQGLFKLIGTELQEPIPSRNLVK